MMESKGNDKRIWSLPGGDRRGTSGADAGRSSMQAIGGEGNGRPSAGKPEQGESNRRYNLRPRKNSSRSTSRAGTQGVSACEAEVGAKRLASTEERGPSRTDWAEKDQEAQSLSSSPKSLFSSIPSSPPSYLDFHTKPSYISFSSSSSPSMAEAVVHPTIVDIPAPTKAKPRAHKKWSEEMNIFILRTYFIITNLEKNTRAYLTELHSKFTEKFPDMHASRQRIGDQRRAIVRNNLLNANTISEVRNEVEAYLLAHQNQTPSQSIQIPPSGRMVWTSEHNEAIIRAYYRITHLETNKTAYRKPLHQNFISVFPHLSHLSEQRIADQRRVIIASKFIDDVKLRSIKQEIASELDTQTANTDLDRSQTEQTLEELNATVWYDALTDNNTSIINNTDDAVTVQSLVDLEKSSDENRNKEVDELFNQAQQYFCNTHPEDRPFIPKQRTSKKLAKVVSYLNEVALPQYVDIDTDFDTLQTTIYCAAWTAAKINGSKLTIPPREAGSKRHTEFTPHWQKRLEKKVEDLRKNIGRMTQFMTGNRSRALTKQVNSLLEKYRTHTTHEEPNSNLAHYLDTMKQKLSVTSSRLKRYKSCSYRKTQNNQFLNNERKFYQSMAKSTRNYTDTSSCQNAENLNAIDLDKLRQFWSKIWEQPAKYKENAEWVQRECEANSGVEPMEYLNIPIDVFHKVIKATHNWKAPGTDHIHSYWYKKLTYIQPYIYNHINSFIKNPRSLPSYITNGITHMIPKDLNDTVDPAKYRPITCLQTIYKIMTSCLSQLIYTHVDTNRLLTEEQKGCRKFSQGCKEQLVIDSIVLKQVLQNKQDMYSIYIDYKKAYDSVPHSWLIKILNIYKVHPQVISFLSHSMINWTTRLQTLTPYTNTETSPIRIQRGIFQGDALSPLWFCLALNPLSNILNSSGLGYKLDSEHDRLTDNFSIHKLTHLLYMDDIKIYASTQTELDRLVEITEMFSKDISMNFGIDKCKINSVRAGQNYQHSYQMETGETIEPLSENESYKYLGYNQSTTIHHKEIKTKLTQNFKHRLNSILKTQLYSKNTIKAINTYAIPILTYSFGVISWTKTELINLQRLINVTMTKHRKHHPRASIQRQILPRIEGGRGLIDIRNLHNRQISTLRKYFHSKTETSTLHKAISKLDIKHTPLNLRDHNLQRNEELTDRQTLVSEWARKSLHGRHHHDLSQPTVDKQASNEWLNRGELFPETEGFMIAIQDQVIETRNYQKHIMKFRLQTDLCRRCNSSSETIQHITGACKALAQTDYKFRHDQVANIIHQRLAAKYNFCDASTKPTPYYKYKPETVLENAGYKLYYDRAILTDRTTHYNRPDLTLLDKNNKTALLIDIAIPNTHNLQSTITEKLSKYIDLKNEITRMWRLEKVSIVPIVISSTGVIPKQLFQSLSLLDLPKHTYILMQKAAILNTCRIVRKFLQNDTASENASINHTDVHLA